MYLRSKENSSTSQTESPWLPHIPSDNIFHSVNNSLKHRLWPPPQSTWLLARGRPWGGQLLELEWFLCVQIPRSLSPEALVLWTSLSPPWSYRIQTFLGKELFILSFGCPLHLNTFLSQSAKSYFHLCISQEERYIDDFFFLTARNASLNDLGKDGIDWLM